MVNFYKYSALVAGHIFMWHINIFTFYKTFWQEVGKSGTVLDLIVICKKKGTIKYSNKIDKFCQMAELCQFEVK